VRHARFGSPRAVIAAALETLGGAGMTVEAASAVAGSTPLGPSRRRYANATAVVRTDLAPLAMLTALKQIERTFGRRRGRRWGARVLDLDIVLWTGGAFVGPGLVVPHPEFRRRGFVLGPAAAVAPEWRDPLTGLTVAQLKARLTRRAALP
jgi:2-amino-4-hydroxy-6-hydroxymethyldihydropteridine diphosphokinase